MDEQSRMYGNWFPNLSFSRKLGSVRAQLSYTAKTQRPTYSQLSNNVTYVDRFTMQRGNPLLGSAPFTIFHWSVHGVFYSYLSAISSGVRKSFIGEIR